MRFKLILPNGLNDYDLYVYSSEAGPFGTPNLVARSSVPDRQLQEFGPKDFEEVVELTPAKSGRYFVVVKAVDFAELNVAAGVCGVECTNVFTVTSTGVPSSGGTGSLVQVSFGTFLMAAQWREWQARAAS